MTRRPSLLPWLLLVTVTGCSPRAATPERSSSPPRADAHPPGSPPPKLVVVVVIDQLASWVLQKYLEYLPEEGAIRRGIARGAFHGVSYPYAGTFTAPGHTSRPKDAILHGGRARFEEFRRGSPRSPASLSPWTSPRSSERATRLIR